MALKFNMSESSDRVNSITVTLAIAK